MDVHMADTQFYVTIGILTAVAAIVSAEVRSPQSLRPASGIMKGTAVLLLLAVWICIAQILLTMMFQNSYELMSRMAVMHFLAHSISLVIMAVLVVMWHLSIARHRETDDGLPADPIAPPTDPNQPGP